MLLFYEENKTLKEHSRESYAFISIYATNLNNNNDTEKKNIHQQYFCVR